jgi:drug/metabolite transporter (DMT)-like permease
MHTNNPRGIALMIGAMALFVGNDALMKYVSQAVPIGQAVFIRGTLVTLILTAIAAGQGQLQHWRKLMQRDVILRAVCECLGAYGYLVALSHIPLAIALSINMSAPLAVLPLAVLLLAERVGWRRWMALLVGFAGVLLVVQPGPDGIDWWALLALVSTFIHALRDVVTRRIPPVIPSVLVTAISATFLTVGSGALAVYEGWQPMPSAALVHMAVAGLMATAAMYLLVVSTRIGEASVVTGFRYTVLIWGIALGYAIWGYLPDGSAWAGIALIVGAGLYAAHRERLRRAGA